MSWSEVKIRAYNAPPEMGGRNVYLFAWQRRDDKLFSFKKPFSHIEGLLEEIPENQHSEPFASLMPYQAQELIDNLWNCGYRPSEGAGSAGSLKATQEHLGDLKTILYHKLGIKGGAG